MTLGLVSYDGGGDWHNNWYAISQNTEGKPMFGVCLTALIEESLGLGQKGFDSCHK
jgi:hypothetical protein